jgi:tetratricopeptide (TPR) repeat protein
MSTGETIETPHALYSSDDDERLEGSMKRRLAATVVVAGLIFAAGCAKDAPVEVAEDPAEAAYKTFRTAYLESENRSDQVGLVEQFLAEYPDNEYAGYFAEDIINYYSRDLGQPERAYQILEPVFAAAEDPELKFDVGTVLVPVAAELGHEIDLQGMVADLEAQGELDFYQTLQVMDAAAAVGDWGLEERYAADAFARSSVEAYRAEYPDREFSDDEVAQRVARRKTAALAHKGWAAFNQGHADEALAMFEEADGLADKNYVGLADGPLAIFWGKALLQHGDPEAAIQVLAPEAIFGDRHKAEPVLREAYATVHESEEGFEDFLTFTRSHLARPVDDFTLANYQGESVSLADVRKDKVTLLAFWFPT